MNEITEPVTPLDMNGITKGFSMLSKAEQLRVEVENNPVNPDQAIICCVGPLFFASKDALRAVSNTVREFRADRLVAKAKKLSGLE